MQNEIYPCLWFDGNAQEAAAYYCSILKNSKIVSNNPIVTIFELNGNNFMGLNGGPKYNFTEATSFVVNCDTQEEIDYYLAKLTAGGEERMCGWLKDKYGVSWQIVSTILGELMGNPEKSQRVIKAFMQMRKFDIEKLLQA